ncbi:MAG: hypothetical protein GY858_02855 [Candidatus Omnitrophica bacterium]|nr:hypothetical protein [Candidatus Omnitrophota bacterium]
MLWHERYRKKHKARLFCGLLIRTIYSGVKGMIKLAFSPSSFKYAVYGKVDDSILVVSSTCGLQGSDGVYHTPYVYTNEDDGIFVFGRTKDCGKDEQDIEKLGLGHKLLYGLALVKSGAYAFGQVRGNLFDKILLTFLWFEWAVSQRWLYAYYLEHALSQVVEKYDIKKIGCVHEMHFYARVAWQVAKKYKTKSYAVQHAAITPGKLWYFAHPEEIEGGLALPDVMHVFNKDIMGLLRPYYANTKFFLGCSYRYSHWKDVVANPDKKGKYYLFAGALASFDNDVLIASLQRVVEKLKDPMKIRIRLHPYAQIKRSKQRWLNAQLKKGLIQMSKGVSLKEDIEGAITVVGMSTTVLEEALLLGRPVIQITNSDYLQYINIEGIEGSLRKDYQDISLRDLVGSVGLRGGSIKMKERLGIGQPLVTYSKLFLS